MKHPKLKILAISSFLLIASLALTHKDSISALDNNFVDGITVDSTLDTADSSVGDGICDDGGGNCTLRAAIEESNSYPDASMIEFNISGTPDFTNNSQNGYTIEIQSELPGITEQTTIDGYSQPGSQANTAVAPNPMNGTLLIEIYGGGTLNGLTGLSLLSGSDNSLIRGLVINSMSGNGINFNGSSNSILQGSYIGTDPSGLISKPIGTDASSSSVAVNICDNGPDTDTTTNNILVGGLNPADRNVVAGNYGGGFGICAIDSVVQGNYIGLAADGVTALGNSFGTGVETGNLTIDYADGLLLGGDDPGAINIISGGSTGGASTDFSNNISIIGNYIGTDYTGTQDLGNDIHGISFGKGGSNSVVRNNLIRFNGMHGVQVWTTVENQNVNDISIFSNQIYDNLALGIDLSDDVYYTNPNDPLDIDFGVNDLLNSPAYTNIQEVSGDTIVKYLLDVPAGDYRIEFFSNTTPDSTGYGEGETYLGFQNVTSTGAGEQIFSHTLTGVTGVTNLAMTSTEIDQSDDGFGATSEFGGYQDPVSDTSITKTLTNPQDIAIGATANYQISYTNNGPDDADLSAFVTPGGAALLYDFVPADLINPSGYLADGPLPGTSIIDVGNPDLTCIYGPAPLAF